MARIIHNILCTVSRRYRVAHCDSVDDLPPRYSRKLRESCRDVDARSWTSAKDMMRDVLAEIGAGDAVAKRSNEIRKAAMFA